MTRSKLADRALVTDNCYIITKGRVEIVLQPPGGSEIVVITPDRYEARLRLNMTSSVTIAP